VDMLHKSFKLEVRSASSLVMRASTGIVTTTSPSSIVLDACNPLPVSGNTAGFRGGELENPNPFNQLWRLRYTGSLLTLITLKLFLFLLRPVLPIAIWKKNEKIRNTLFEIKYLLTIIATSIKLSKEEYKQVYESICKEPPDCN